MFVNWVHDNGVLSGKMRFTRFAGEVVSSYFDSRNNRPMFIIKFVNEKFKESFQIVPVGDCWPNDKAV